MKIKKTLTRYENAAYLLGYEFQIIIVGNIKLLENQF